MGDCACYHGNVAGRPVDVDSIYVDRSRKSPHEAKHDDIYAKMAKIAWRLWQDRSSDVIRIPGCPVSVAEQALLLVQLAGLKNPYFDPKMAVGFTSSYLSWRTRTLLKRVLGQPYQTPGATERGDARPPQSLPPEGASTRLEAR
jgi:hypothetical protein